MDDRNKAYRDFGLLGPELLELRTRIGADLLPVDVADIIEEHPELVDERIREFVLRGLRGELKKKRGPKRKPTQRLKELYAETLYDDLYPRIEARYERERAKGRVYGAVDLAPSELAYAITAKHVGMTMEGVRNLISARRILSRSGFITENPEELA